MAPDLYSFNNKDNSCNNIFLLSVEKNVDSTALVYFHGAS